MERQAAGRSGFRLQLRSRTADAERHTRYDVWRDYDPEASVRFYALRMQETGMIKSSPQQIIAEGTDCRFLNELKRELKT